MSRTPTRCAFAILVLALVALPAAGESFEVVMNDGSTFETRYQPQEASWDPSLVLLLTEVGNWIGLPKNQIASVVAEFGESNFGARINSTTISLGLAPNNAEIPDEGEASGAAAAQNQQNALLESYLQQRDAEQSYTIQQFVEPGQTMGVPSRFVGSPTGGVGGGSGLPFPPQLPPRQ